MSIVTHSKFLLNSCIALNKKRGFHPYAKYEQKINPLFGGQRTLAVMAAAAASDGVQPERI